mmetsp:Transcript_6072/g.14705  ORF Transcript_6072/g.14705 Transcript_6072/m.14705 type:complete len:506 (-) Transcript_6072:312-1829(-)
MEFKVFSTVVYPVVDDDPNVVFGIVLGNFSLGENLLLAFLFLCRSSGYGFFGNSHFEKLSETSGCGLVGETSHPSTLDLTGLGWLFETENVFIICVLLHVNLEAENLVVTHSHKIPSRMVWLGHVRLVPSTAHNFLAANKIGNLEIVVPPRPAPVHSVISWFFLSVQGRKIPVDTAISTDFDSGNHTTATGVGIPRNIVGLGNVLCDWKFFVVKRRCHRRVDVELVKDVFRSVPPFFLQGLFRGDMRREDTVVVVVIMVLGFMRNDIDLLEPLNHSTTDVTGDNKTDRVSVIGLQFFAIGLVRNDNVVRRIHSSCERNRGSILDLLAPRFVFEWTWANFVGKIFDTDEFYVLTSHVLLLNTSGKEQIPQSDSLPYVGRNTTRAPVEPNCLANLVLFFSSISSTHERDRKFSWFGQGDNFIHGEFHRFADTRPSDFDGVLFPGEARACTVVTNVMKRRRRDKSSLTQFLHRWFDVERVATGQTDQSSVTGEPLVRSSNITMIGVFL